MQQYKKIFLSSKSENIAFGQPYLHDITPVEEDVNSFVDKLINADNEDKRHLVKIQLLREFRDIYEYDCKTAEWTKDNAIDISKLERKRKILGQDITLYLGNIYKFFHKEYALKYDDTAFHPNTFVDYGEMYWYAVNDYFGKLQGYETTIYWRKCSQIENYAKSNKSYLAAFILPVLIERTLNVKFRNLALSNILSEVDKLNSLSVLNEEQRRLVDSFREANKKGGIFQGDPKVVLGKLWGAFCKLRVVNKHNDKELEQWIIDEKLTLSKILKSQYFHYYILPEYQALFCWLFDDNYLNLRNIAMHGTNKSYNYFSLYFSSIMLQLFWDMQRQEIYITNKSGRSSQCPKN